MPITKRTIPKPKPPVKLHPAKARHLARCESLYNRLHDDLHSACAEIADLINVSYNDVRDLPYLGEHIMARFNTEVHTLQINYEGDCVSFRCVMRYTDRSKPPLHGYLYPSLSVVTVSTSMGHAVMLAYVALCKRAWKFL